MDTSLSISIAFLLGLASSFHCMAMCGGIISALSLGLPGKSRGNSPRHLLLVSSYNLGRIASYTVAGAIAGLLGSLSPLADDSGRAYGVLQYIAAAFLVALGLHIAGYLPFMKKFEAAGLLLWNYIRPLGKSLLPADTVARSLAVGAIWGWLPCGLVYSVLLWAMTSVNYWQAALYMFVFGLGTLPSMLSVGVASKAVSALSVKRNLRKTAGLLIVLLGLASLGLQVFITEHKSNGAEAGPAEHSHHLP